MINKNIRRILLGGLVLSAVAFSSCNKQDNDVFGKLPSEREKEQASKLEQLLVAAPNGWKLLYYTDDTELGGFSFLMKFNEKGTVEMLSDFDEESYTRQVSDFEIQLRGTTSLVFVTENKIHKLSDPYNSPTTGNKGYKGDFQFRYYSDDENEITFRATKDIKQVIKLVKATAEDWSAFENRKPFIENFSSYEIPVFRQIVVTENGEEKIYDGTYTGVTRFLSTFTDASSIGIEKGIGIGFTNEGTVVSPALDIKGEKFSNFEWSDSQSEFVSTNSGDVKVKIRNTTEPYDWSDSYKQLVFGNAETIAFLQTDAVIMSSASNTQPFYDAMVADNEYIITQLAIFMQRGKLTIQYSNDKGNFGYVVTAEDSNNKGKLLLKNGRWASSNVPADIKGLHEKLFGTGILFVKLQTYRVGGPNEIISFYSGGDAVVFDTWISG